MKVNWILKKRIWKNLKNKKIKKQGDKKVNSKNKYKNMRVLIDTRPLLEKQPTGVSIYIQQLLNEFFKLQSEHEYFLFINCAKDEIASRLPNWPNTRVIRTKIPSKILNTWISLTGKPELEKLIGQKFDLFISLNPHFCPNKKIPHILMIHDISVLIDKYLFSPYQRFWHKAIKLVQQIKNADTLLTVSENTKKDLIDLLDISQEKIHVLYPGLPVDFKNSQNFKVAGVFNGIFADAKIPQKKSIIVLGTREKRKNIENIIHAFALAHRKHDNIELDLVGPPGYGWAKAKKLIHKYKIQDSVNAHGYISDAKKWNLISNAEINLYPSLYEGFGLPVIEAMLCKIPTITSSGSSLVEAAGNSALLINPWQPDMIAHAIDQVLTNSELRDKLKSNTQEHLQKFSWNNSARKLLNIINNYANRN